MARDLRQKVEVPPSTPSGADHECSFAGCDLSACHEHAPRAIPTGTPSSNLSGGGRPPISHDIVLRVIWFVLTTGCSWRKLPAGMGCSGETARTRFAHWEELGIWRRLYASVLTQLHRTQALNLEVVIVDSTHVRAFRGGAVSGPSPVNRRKTGTKYTVMTDGNGTPLVMISTPANTSDHRCLMPVVELLSRQGGFGQTSEASTSVVC
ncbi:hypothetical protein Plim_1059 [Planctopirus limnophila DSM 3776]|uniref:Uncharacterized protein n=1 Tax=Planctopirus limnophila (strain ATCC 43296 / DSM 3776 / IFAM 1008 / Mu 290) TaxID=521674 RepID=D5STD1_PLAL2|nr:transposase [Planctopirus limnophila]ADG66899.1 hypothetical protein Plim_1059 [Planctopirus limnophila DSM 3776]